MNRWKGILGQIGCGCHILPQKSYFAPKSGYFSTKMPMQSLGHQTGTCKFGEDAKSSVLDLNCRSHDVDNLYVVDGSFFISSGAVNPTLTIIANALRVGDHLLERMNASSAFRETTPSGEQNGTLRVNQPWQSNAGRTHYGDSHATSSGGNRARASSNQRET